MTGSTAANRLDPSATPSTVPARSAPKSSGTSPHERLPPAGSDSRGPSGHPRREHLDQDLSGVRFACRHDGLSTACLGISDAHGLHRTSILAAVGLDRI